jgi:hypothetical protein
MYVALFLFFRTFDNIYFRKILASVFPRALEFCGHPIKMFADCKKETRDEKLGELELF